VPADEAVFPWFEEVLADIGDAQSITESLSTFSAHIRQITRMLERAGERSLVLLDELGAATDPEEGGALGVAIVDHFRALGAFAVVSTHLPALKTFAATTAGVRNASMGFDAQTLSPNYRLAVGIPGQSAGLAMARRFGIAEAVIARAEQVLGTHAQQAATFLQHLQEQVEQHETAQRNLRIAEQRLREKERDLAEKWERQRTLRLAELEQRVGQLIGRLEGETRAALEKLEEDSETRRVAKQAQRATAQRHREFRREVQQAASEALEIPAAAPQSPPAQISAGALVRLAGLGATARVVRKISEDDWEVEAGSLKMRVTAADISEVLPAAQPVAGRLPSRVSFQGATRPRGALSEINVIGKNSEEARDAVDKFLDDAVLAEIERVRVIHGHGFQVLRKALWQMFTNHPHVERYYQAEQHEGGAGATIVEVRL
jgi:DNA mismatch repair protein MutS2